MVDDPRLIWQQAKRHLDSKQFQAALPLLARLARIVPADPAVHFNLGSCLVGLGRHEEAIAPLERVIRLSPGFPDAWRLLGRALALTGEGEKAADVLRSALRHTPTDEAARLQLARVYLMTGRGSAAIDALSQAPVWTRRIGALLAEALLREERPLEALDQAELVAAHVADGGFLVAAAELAAGRPAVASSHFRQVAERSPNDSRLRSADLMATLYLDELMPTEVAARHIAWGREIEHKTPTVRLETPALRQGRRLRVGYVSPDFRYHAVARFVLPVLEDHDRTMFDVFCYSNVARPDGMTAQIAAAADHWRSIHGVADEKVVEQIARDGIDILVDLAGHSHGNRLPVFARKPAPLQLSWLGYPATTGLTTIDFQVLDSVVAPPAEDHLVLRSERPLRLKSGFHRLAPLSHLHVVQPPPLTAPLTFVSFNAIAKHSTATIRLWARTLHAVPSSRLLIKRKALIDRRLHDEFLARFQAEGIHPDRLEFASDLKSTEEHLAQYQVADAALDSVPYNGTTTTCDALWMGIPVVALHGDRHCARMSASLLTQIGATEWIARNDEEFVAIAARLAEQGRRTAASSHALRARFAASSLASGRDVILQLETALCQAWDEKFGAPQTT